MDYCTKYIDTSMASLIIGLVCFVFGFLGVQYVLNHYINDPEKPKYDDNQVNVISLFSSVIITLIVLILYKQYLERVGLQTVITESFYS